MSKKWFIKILMVFMCMFFWTEYVMAEETNQRKQIHIVFDNSGSMVGKDHETGNPNVTSEGNSPLADAAYALQVMLSMLGKEDVVYIYPISKFDLKYEYADEEAIPLGSDIFHDTEALCEFIKDPIATHMAENTYFTAVSTALEDLNGENTDAEKWLVVLTDGIYEDKDDNGEKFVNVAYVHSELSKSEYEDINIIHYSFGDSSYYEKTVNDRKDNITYYPMTEGKKDEMLEIMIDIGNQILGRQEVAVTNTANNTVTFSLEASAKSVLVFAQTEEKNSELEIKNSTMDEVCEIARTQNVKTIPKKDIQPVGLKGQNQTYVADNICSGMIRIYTTDEFLEKNTYEISVAGIGEEGEIHVYYEPILEGGLNFKNQASKEKRTYANSEKVIQLQNGSYEITPCLLYPSVSGTNGYDSLGENTNLYKNMTYTIEVLKDGEKVSDGNSGAGWQGELISGTYTVVLDAKVFEGFHIYAEREIEAVDFLQDITAELSGPENGINVEALGSGENYLTLTLYNNGEILSEEYRDKVNITHINETESLYTYQTKKIESGWQLWPQRKRNVSEYEFQDVIEEQFEITLKVGEIEMEPIILKEKVTYYGETFSVSFKTSWGESVGIIDYFLGNMYIEPLINSKSIDWDIVELVEMIPQYWKNSDSPLGLEIVNNKWKLTRQISFFDLLKNKDKRESTQEIAVSIALKRYGQTESISKDIRIKIDITVKDIIISAFISILALYLLLIFIYKYTRKIYVGNVYGYIEYCIDPVNNLSIKMNKCILYNLFVPGRMKFEVYLNRIAGGDGKKIVFKCSPGNACVIDNIQECQSFSPLRINCFLADENSIYDLEKKLKIVVEKDSGKTIVVYKSR